MTHTYFPDYEDLYGTTPADIAASLTDPEHHALALSAVAEDLEMDDGAIRRSVSGDLEQPLGEMGKLLHVTPQHVSAQGVYAVGVLKAFARSAASFDQKVAALTAEAQRRLHRRLSTDAVTGLEAAATQVPLTQAETRAAYAAIMDDLWPQYKKARRTLEDQGDNAAALLKAGPTPANVRMLVAFGLIPLDQLAKLWPDLKLSIAERRAAYSHLDPTSSLWNDLHAMSKEEWLTLVSDQVEDDGHSYAYSYLDETVPFDQLPTGYYGAGSVTGPDGLEYPLVIPNFRTQDGMYDDGDGNPLTMRRVPDETPGTFYQGGSTPELSIEELGGNDPGWHILGSRTGVDMLAEPSSLLEKLVVSAGTASGGTSGTVNTSGHRSDLLDQVWVNPNGQPVLSGNPDANPQARGIPAGDPRDNPLDPQPNREVPQNHGPPRGTPEQSSRGTTSANALQLLVGAADGAGTFRNYDEHNNQAFHITFEENDDGRRRAILNTYDVNDKDGHPDPVWYRSYVDSDGDLKRVPVTPYNPHGRIG